MRLLVIGAAGRIGRPVIEKALGHGHEVTAFVHRVKIDLTHPRLAVYEGDVRDAESVAAAVGGHDAVAFALSPLSSDRGILDAGIANVIYGMAVASATRLAAVSAAGTFDRGSSYLGLGYRVRIATTLRTAFDDLEAMERRIMASDLDWTIVRPMGLSDEPATGHYRVSLDGGLLKDAKRIPREDVASVVLKALETDTYRRRAVVIGL